jgi:protein-S-isoprenylcysteine O-methyltransferase Ste14
MALSVVVIVGYAALYSVAHSWLASRRMKDWTQRALGPAAERWYRLVYNLLGGVTLLPFLPMLAWLPDRILYTLPSPWLWLALLGQLVAVVGLVYGVWLTDVWHFWGLRQILEPQAGTGGTNSPRLVVSGMYRWVRHPVYFCGLVFIWLMPQMTVNQLVLSAIFSVYLYVGTFFEERRLVAEFGDDYRQYQRRVPRLMPAPWALRWRRPV